MKMHNLRDFLAIAERGSINAAARHLGIGQPALSRSVRALEREVGAPLLERHSTGTVLTPTGQAFAHRASSAVQELRRACDEARQMHGDTQGSLVVCISGVAHVALMAEALAPFYMRYPHVQIRVVEGFFPQVEERLRAGALDFYVGPAPRQTPSAELLVEKLFDNPRAVLARRGHPRQQATSLAELQDMPWVATATTADMQYGLDELFARAGLTPPHIAFRADSALSWITALTATDLLAISSARWVDSPLTRGMLVVVPVCEPIAAPAIVMVRRAALPLTPAAEYFSDLLGRSAMRMAAAF